MNPSSEVMAHEIASKAKELFAHLPEGEIGDDEALEFKQDSQGNLLVRTTHAGYAMRNGCAWRVVPGPEGDVVSQFRNGKLIHEATSPHSPAA